MLAIQPGNHSSGQKCTPNILPCRIIHDGPANASERYWEPTVEDDKARTAYFRGRKLRGKPIKVPEGYRGAVMCSTDKTLPQGNNSNQSSGDTFMPGDDTSADEDNEKPEEIRIMQEHASFNEIVVWGHETMPDTSTDPYAKSMEEWIAFAEQVGWKHLENQVQSGGLSTETAQNRSIHFLLWLMTDEGWPKWEEPKSLRLREGGFTYLWPTLLVGDAIWRAALDRTLGVADSLSALSPKAGYGVTSIFT
ncbi:MAG: 3'-5' exonuclease [Trichoglossum hirsutum]|nr:MAG: 3'-5' exonuclease [Trichoglossum hirsutum]